MGLSPTTGALLSTGVWGATELGSGQGMSGPTFPGTAFSSHWKGDSMGCCASVSPWPRAAKPACWEGVFKAPGIVLIPISWHDTTAPSEAGQGWGSWGEPGPVCLSRVQQNRRGPWHRWSCPLPPLL